MADTTRTKITKSRSGCSACKKKRMKCDETVPQCRNCLHRKIQCPGYERQLKWSTKYERYRLHKRKEGPRVEAIPASRVIPLHQASDTIAPRETDSDTLDRGRQERSQASSKRRRTSPPSTSHGDLEQVVPSEATLEDHLLLPDECHEAFGLYHRTFIENNEEGVNANAESLYDASSTELTIAPKIDSYLQSAIWKYVSDNDDCADKLVAHYFDVICQVMSCFDSASNPYRTDIPQSLSISPHIFDCLMTTSAAHMANYVNEYIVTTLRYQTKAMSSLQAEMARLALDEVATTTTSKNRFQLLLGTIIIGMTSAWHDPAAYSLAHLQGARSLFQAWSVEQDLVNEDGKAILLNREQSFVVGSMAYWECLASVLIDQSLQKLDYLKPFCKLAEGQITYPNSWTGVSTPTFIYLAQVGVLLRQKRVLEKLMLINRGYPLASADNSGILEDARAIHDQFLNYSLPWIETMEETGDPNTPLSHLIDVAKVYRFVVLLELYQAFPSLIEPERGQSTASRSKKVVFDLATSALTILSTIARTSGVFTVLSLAYISSGSAIQMSLAPKAVSNTTTSTRLSIDAELNDTHHGKSAVQWWRDNVRQHIIHAHKRLGIASLGRGAKVVQEVWNRSDLQAEMANDVDALDYVHWLDVMVELRLETLYG